MSSKKTMTNQTGMISATSVMAVFLLACSLSHAAFESSEGPDEDAKMEFKAKTQFDKGVELMQTGETERGLKLVADVVRMFPTSKACLAARLHLGRHYLDKKDFNLAIRHFRGAEASADEAQRAEALYQIGICHYNLGAYAKAFVSLRRVANEHPWSVYANQAYYYIGLCHYKLGHWAKAVDALELVGTSVPMNVKTVVRAEAGQRLFIKVHDKDLVVLLDQQGELTIAISAESGDREEVVLRRLGRTVDHFIGSIRTEPGTPEPGDGVLQIRGTDKVTSSYVDENTLAGELNKEVLSTVELVSTAVAAFTDGALREQVKGAFVGSDTFVRVKDLDHDRTDERDTLPVRIFTRYDREKEDAAEAASYEESREVVVRDNLSLTLAETSAHSGVFAGTVVPVQVSDPADVNTDDSQISVLKGDELCLQYVDDLHIDGSDPRKLTASAKVLIGQIKDVRVEHRVVETPDLRAQKNVIEANIFLRLGQLFKEVGLRRQANDQAGRGLLRIDDVLGMRENLDRKILEEAFSVKWDLLLVQDRLNEAIAVCQTLMQMFPDSTLVDQALFRIAEAKWQSQSYQEAIQLFNGLIALPQSEKKAEAQFCIAKIQEELAVRRAEQAQQNRGESVPVDKTAALTAYKRCADQYPDSPFAGESLREIVTYYIEQLDYPRALELLEQIFQDHPDAEFLDKMLQLWVVAAYRVGQYPVAKEKAEQLIAEYPDSEVAAKVKQYLGIIDGKLN